MKINSLIVVLFILLFSFLVYSYTNTLKENSRISKNQSSLIRGINYLVLNKDEFKEYLDINNSKLLDIMSDSLDTKIRVNNINRYNTTTINYRDTNIIEVPIVKVNDTYPFSYNDTCWGVKGLFDINDNKLFITEKSFSTPIITVDYVKREPIKWLFGLRLGKKKTGLFIISPCGKVERTEIEIN